MVPTIVDGNFCVTEVGRRNRNFRVENGIGHELFVKQTKASDTGSLANFKREIDSYVLARTNPAWNKLLPRVLDIDEDRYSIVLEFIKDSESLTQYHWRIRRFSNLIAEISGQALARFHVSTSLSLLPKDFLQTCRRKPVWILNFDSVPKLASGGSKKMLALMQQHPVIREGLQVVERDWKFDCLIHGDMKWDNCLVHPDQNQTPQLKLIDWELIDVGDAHWDIAGLMHSFFVFWIEIDQRDTRQEPASSIEELIARENPLHNALRQSLLVYWHAYQTGVGAKDNDRADLVRCLRFVAARLVLTCYEGVCTEKEMSISMSLVLQLARIIFEDPEKMALLWFPERRMSDSESNLA